MNFFVSIQSADLSFTINKGEKYEQDIFNYLGTAVHDHTRAKCSGLWPRGDHRFR